MAKNDYLRKIQQQNMINMREYGFIARMQVLDKVTIALGQMGMDPDFIAKFEDEYCAVEHEYCKEVIEDSNIDRELVYSTVEIDRAIKQYVREDRFVPHDKRYDMAAHDRLRKLCFGR